MHSCVSAQELSTSSRTGGRPGSSSLSPEEPWNWATAKERRKRWRRKCVCKGILSATACRVVRGARLGELPTCQVRPNWLIAGTCHDIVSIFWELGMSINFLSNVFIGPNSDHCQVLKCTIFLCSLGVWNVDDIDDQIKAEVPLQKGDRPSRLALSVSQSLLKSVMLSKSHATSP